MSALPNKGLPEGQRPPVEPPAVKAAGAAAKVDAQRWSKLEKPAKGCEAGKESREREGCGKLDDGFVEVRVLYANKGGNRRC